MPKYLVQATYTAEGFKGLQKEGASGRVEAISKAATALGGKCEAVYWAFGDQDVIAIFDLPTPVDGAALAFAVSGSGAARTRTTPLLTAAEADAALKKSVSYRAPGK